MMFSAVVLFCGRSRMNLFFFWLSDGHVVGGTPEKKK